MFKESKPYIGLAVSFIVFIVLFNFAFFSSTAYAKKAGTCTLTCKDSSTHSCPAPCEVRGETLYCNGAGTNYTCFN